MDFEDFITVRNSVVPRCHDSTELDFSPLLFYFFFFLQKINNEGNTPSLRSNLEDFITVRMALFHSIWIEGLNRN